MAVLQLRTAMVQGQTGTLSLDVRSSVDKGVSTDSTAGLSSEFMHESGTLIFLSVVHRGE